MLPSTTSKDPKGGVLDGKSRPVVVLPGGSQPWLPMHISSSRLLALLTKPLSRNWGRFKLGVEGAGTSRRLWLQGTGWALLRALCQH